MEQGTDAWLQARVGKVTASRVADVIAKTKSGYGASRKNYMAQLVAERLTGEPSTSFTNAAMEWGTEHEAAARAGYAQAMFATVTEVGLIDHPTIAMAAASPDGLVDDDGLIEIKCPNTATHIDTLIAQKPPKKYITQMMWQMACTGRKWCDFTSYDPRLPPHLMMFVERVERDNALIAELELEVSGFLTELDEKVKLLNNINKENA